MVLVVQDPINRHIFLVQSFNADKWWKFYRVDLERCECSCPGWEHSRDKSYAAFEAHKHVNPIMVLAKSGKISFEDTFGVFETP